MTPLVIIGSGLAGYSLLREYRKRDPDTPVTLVTADDGRVYAKPNLSNALAQGREPDQLASETAAQATEKYRARVLTQTRITAIDRNLKQVLADGLTIPYGRLVLALGADPMAHGLSGDALDRVFAVNDLTDYTRFRAALSDRRRIAILGGGLIGCEFANDLAARGYQVEVIHRGYWPLDRLIPESVGKVMIEGLESRGVAWHFGRSARSVHRSTASGDESINLVLDDGSVLTVDLVLSAIGLRSRTELAKDAGLAVNRGIVVDRQLRTSAPSIHAIGDCAEVDGMVRPFIQPLLMQCKALAAVLMGEASARLAYPAMPVVVKTPACPLVVAAPPHDAPGEWRLAGTGQDLIATYLDREGQLLGFALTGHAFGQRNDLTNRLPATLP